MITNRFDGCFCSRPLRTYWPVYYFFLFFLQDVSEKRLINKKEIMCPTLITDKTFDCNSAHFTRKLMTTAKKTNELVNYKIRLEA